VRYRRLFVLVLLLLVVAAARRARLVNAGDEWPPISPEELQMSSVPEAPGAPAVYLYRQVDRDDQEAHEYNYLLDGPSRDTDVFEIILPSGYEVDDLPPPVNADYSFASYHSKTEVSGSTLKYSRTFEVKELSVPLSKADDLKKLYRIIASDERNTAVLKPVTH
jgi:hypothetical protein